MSSSRVIARSALEVARLTALRDRRARAVAHAALRLATGALTSDDERAVTRRVERLRRELEADERVVGGGARHTIGYRTRQTSKGPRWIRFLTRLVLDLRPNSILEMGTSVGVSGSALALSAPEGGRLTTVEGRPEVAEVARETFRRAGVSERTDVRVGMFSDVLEDAFRAAAPIDLLFVDGHHDEFATPSYLDQALPHLADGALVLFDDIHWSPGMERAWDRIRAHPRAELSADLYQLGVWATGEVPAEPEPR